MFKHMLNKFSLLQSLTVMVLISLILPLPLILVTYAYGTYETKQDKQNTINSKKFNLSAEIFVESLWNFYPELGKKMMDQLLLDPAVLYVKVIDINKKDFLQGENKGNASLYDVTIMQKTLEKDGMAIGSLEIGFHKLRLLESVISDMTLFGSIILLQTLLVIFVISLIYYKKIVKPIRRLVEHSTLLSQQKLDEPFVWEKNDEIGTLGVALNDTRIKLKSLFEALKYENETLDEKVKQRTLELENASRYKSEFLANMSHEIRTPMNAITGMLHFLSKTALNATQANYITKIKEASSVLLHIINDILDYSKIEAGKMEVENIAFDMHKELKKSCSIFSILAKERNITLTCDFIHTHRFFKGDPYKIMQIVNNFLSNAIKFTSQGFVRLCVNEQMVDEQNESILLFSVTDSGIGISQEKQLLLFKAFGQLDASITRKHGGTGLGLYICTQLSTMMNGKIYVESEENKGSTFSFEIKLPMIQGSEILNENQVSDFQPLHILLIEDDEKLSDNISSMIRSFGYFVTHKKSNDHLNSFINDLAEPFHLVILDAALEKEDGLSLFKKISHTPHAEKISNVLMLCDNSSEEFKRRALAAGIKSTLSKPVNPSMLYDEITLLCNVSTTKPPFDPSQIDLSQKKILVVEDNDINMEVALYLLKDTRAIVEAARNGLEAIDKVKQYSYDAILMDLQMPLMDGYEATRLIRKELNINTPIIAMTANVMAQDVEKCLSSGMDFHIGKPFDVEDFYGVLLEALHVNVTLQKPEHKEIAIKQRFNKQGATQKLGGSEILWQKVFRSFYEQYLPLEETLQHLHKEQNLTLMIDYIHTLKGLSGTVGAFMLQEESLKIETLLKKNKTLESIDFEPLLAEYHQLFTILKDEYTHIAQDKMEETLLKYENIEEILILVNDLLVALEASNVSRINLILDNLVLFENVQKHSVFKSIVLSCKQFDFEAAHQSAQYLKEEFVNG
ncbi:MAG: response regulator [Sulfurospirillaceae bacterium]|nr:response regulator [Sulfurospirillaceae bacterium]MDD2825774.1 response regulator [Sulfurospirillaceae bacterium]